MRDRDEGSAVAEMVIITPVLVILALAMVALGRLVQARLDVDDAAKQAARAASLTRTPYAAQWTATTTGDAALGGVSPACATKSVHVDTAEFRPGGTVTVTVTCTVSMAGLSLVPIGGHESISSSFTEPLDRWISSGSGP
jgi:Flp pilus assembly protein TadG